MIPTLVGGTYAYFERFSILDFRLQVLIIAPEHISEYLEKPSHVQISEHVERVNFRTYSIHKTRELKNVLD